VTGPPAEELDLRCRPGRNLLSTLDNRRSGRECVLVDSYSYGGVMNSKTAIILALLLVSAAPLNAGGKKNKGEERGMLEKMEAVPCGAKQKGLTGLGSIWASAGVTDVHSDEKMCPQYLLRTDEMDYRIRPRDGKHPVVLPVGQEVEFKIKKDNLFLKVPDGDRKTRAYQVVSMTPANPDHPAPSAENKSLEKP
jgi:hypothetical protein